MFINRESCFGSCTFSAVNVTLRLNCFSREETPSKSTSGVWFDHVLREDKNVLYVAEQHFGDQSN